MSQYEEVKKKVTRIRPNFEPDTEAKDDASFDDFVALLNGQGQVEYGAGLDGTLYTPPTSPLQWRANNVNSPLLFNQRFKDVANLHNSLYFGEANSIFAAHTEEADSWSINFIHSGAPKEWTVCWPSALDSIHDVITAACTGMLVVKQLTSLV